MNKLLALVGLVGVLSMGGCFAIPIAFNADGKDKPPAMIVNVNVSGEQSIDVQKSIDRSSK